MDHTAELRKTYLGAAPHTFVTAIIWLSSGLVGQFYSKTAAMVVFIVLCSFIFPLGELMRKLLKAPTFLSNENKLGQFFTLLAFTIPLSYPLIYLACRNNINFFFPAFTVLVGAHYLPFVYGYGMKTFALLAALLVAAGTMSFTFFPELFSLSAYITAGALFVFGTIHFLRTKKEII